MIQNDTKYILMMYLTLELNILNESISIQQQIQTDDYIDENSNM